jgi:hypothetical protein
MCVHNDARSKLKYLAYFPVLGVFRAPGTDVTSQQCRSVDSVQSRLLIAAAVLDSPAKRPMCTEGTEIGRQRTNEHFLTT